MPNPNLALLETSAQKLAPLLGEIVFVGGCATGLLINDPGAAVVRKTYDVDIIAEIASYAEYGIFSERLRLLDFTEDSSEGAPLCRWKSKDLILDVMPLDPGILGFSNRWYEGALRTSRQAILSKDITIRVITAPYFLGTKLEAFRGRGKGDFFASHDLEDFVAVIDGRREIAQELLESEQPLRNYVASAVTSLLSESRFLDALPGYLLPDAANQARISLLMKKLSAIASLNGPGATR
jgi:hypothetical protein